MQFNAQVKVLGAKKFNDTIDGQHHDFTKVFIEMPLDDKTGNAKGFAAQEMNWGDSNEFSKISHLPFPFVADVTVELVTSGRSQRQRIVDLKPVARAAKEG